jgi:hypothetical protein
MSYVLHNNGIHRTAKAAGDAHVTQCDDLCDNLVLFKDLKTSDLVLKHTQQATLYQTVSCGTPYSISPGHENQ